MMHVLKWVNFTFVPPKAALQNKTANSGLLIEFHLMELGGPEQWAYLSKNTHLKQSEFY